jgi:hypothetical protein
MVCLIYFSDALGMIHMEPEPPATANDSCHMSRDIVWLSGGGDEGDLSLSPIWSCKRAPVPGSEQPGRDCIRLLALFSSSFLPLVLPQVRVDTGATLTWLENLPTWSNLDHEFRTGATCKLAIALSHLPINFPTHGAAPQPPTMGLQVHNETVRNYGKLLRYFISVNTLITGFPESP